MPSSDNDAARAWYATNPQLTTQRYVLRALTHADAFYAAMDNPRVNRWMGSFEQPFTYDAAMRWLNERLQRQVDGVSLYLGICNGQTNELLGFFGTGTTHTYGMPELSWALCEQAWGQRVIDEIGPVVLEQLRLAGVTRVCATAALDNDSSSRIMDLLGMVQTGECLFERPDGTVRPSRFFERQL